jgi:hypothetical protein
MILSSKSSIWLGRGRQQAENWDLNPRKALVQSPSAARSPCPPCLYLPSREQHHSKPVISRAFSSLLVLKGSFISSHLLIPDGETCLTWQNSLNSIHSPYKPLPLYLNHPIFSLSFPYSPLLSHFSAKSKDDMIQASQWSLVTSGAGSTYIHPALPRWAGA